MNVEDKNANRHDHNNKIQLCQDRASQVSKEWYYYPWVWFILALLASAVIGSFATLHIAIDRPNDLLPVAVSKFALESAEDKTLMSPLQPVHNTME